MMWIGTIVALIVVCVLGAWIAFLIMRKGARTHELAKADATRALNLAKLDAARARDEAAAHAQRAQTAEGIVATLQESVQREVARAACLNEELAGARARIEQLEQECERATFASSRSVTAFEHARRAVEEAEASRAKLSGVQAELQRAKSTAAEFEAKAQTAAQRQAAHEKSNREQVVGLRGQLEAAQAKLRKLEAAEAEQLTRLETERAKHERGEQEAQAKLADAERQLAQVRENFEESERRLAEARTKLEEHATTSRTAAALEPRPIARDTPAKPDSPAVRLDRTPKPEPTKREPPDLSAAAAWTVFDAIHSDASLREGQREVLRAAYQRMRPNVSLRSSPPAGTTVLAALDSDTDLTRGQKEAIRTIYQSFGRRRS